MSSTNRTVEGAITLVNGLPDVAWRGKPPEAEPGVYEIRAPEAVPRLRGASNILYIGRSGSLLTRMGQLAAGDHGVTERVQAVLEGADLWGEQDLSTRACSLVAHLTEGEGSDPELEEVRRIARYLEAHCELPPLNRNSPGYLPFLALRRIMEGLAARLKNLKGFGDRSLKVPQARDDADDDNSYVELKFLGVDRLKLVWTWPAAWRTSVRRPGWWPGGPKMPYRAEALYLFVAHDWAPKGPGPVPHSKFWRLARQDEPWRGLNEGIPLPWELLSSAPDAFTALLSKGSLGALGKPLKPDARLGDALREVWADLGDRVREVIQQERAAPSATRVAEKYLTSQEEA